MKKIYLVDSENVGDVWVPLLVSSQPEDMVLVFYTQKSPHMNYENVRMLKETEKEAVFLKCFEGNNALDFQLVSELGYRLREDADSEYVIVSNDTGFDAVVRYWSAKEFQVSRLSGKECYRQLVSRKQRGEQKRQEGSGQPEKPESSGQPEKLEKQEGLAQSQKLEKPEGSEQPLELENSGQPENSDQSKKPESSGQSLKLEQSENSGQSLKPEKPENSGQPQKLEQSEEQEQLQSREQMVSEEQLTVEAEEPSVESAEPGEQAAAVEEKMPETSEIQLNDVVKTLFCCISKENPVDFHNALVAFLGEEEGKALYQEIKGNAEYTTYWAALPKSSQKEKFEFYCRLVFAHSEYAGEAPEDFADFLYQSNGKRKNLNSLRAALQGKYGKDKGMKYYSLFKSHIKIMNRM